MIKEPLRNSLNSRQFFERERILRRSEEGERLYKRAHGVCKNERERVGGGELMQLSKPAQLVQWGGAPSALAGDTEPRRLHCTDGVGFERPLRARKGRLYAIIFLPFFFRTALRSGYGWLSGNAFWLVLVFSLYISSSIRDWEYIVNYFEIYKVKKTIWLYIPT